MPTGGPMDAPMEEQYLLEICLQTQQKKGGGEIRKKKEMIVKKSEARMKEVKRQWIMERRL